MGCCCAKHDQPKSSHTNSHSTRKHGKSRKPRKPGKSNKKTIHQLSPTSQGEQECLQALKKLYPGHRFVKSRPNFLRHPETGRCLELDLYCEELKIAVEYNGRQHYEYTPHFHTSPQDLHDQMERDRLKLKLCRKYGIQLIVVPHTVPLSDIHAFLKRKLKLT